jgi:two-component system chemotaxis response regulator CheY
MKILIVDDDVVSRMMLMHMIAGTGSHEVLEAEDGEDAWRQLDAGAGAGAGAAMLFCDLRMPRLSGMELLARVKADGRFADLPFVLVSAADDGATMEQARGLGAAGYIVKPFNADEVRAHLAHGARGGEGPVTTMRRLGIDAARLLLYLGGLHRQLASACADIGQLLAAGEADAARAQLGRLAEGCRTLGLLDAAAALDSQAAALPLSALAARRELEAACGAVLRQAEAARHQAGA